MTECPPSDTLGLVAGGGSLPFAAAEAAIAAGRGVHIVAIRGEADAALGAYPHTWLRWDELGRVFSIFRAEGCREVVIVGAVGRPDPGTAKLGIGALKNVPLVLSLMTSGDGNILSNVIRTFEDRGFIVRGADEIAPDLVMPAGVIGRYAPKKTHREDIRLARQVIETLGPYDVGQAVVVSGGHVLAIEAAEGTDAMLERVAALSHRKRAGAKGVGVLVKFPKPGQDRRIDLPTIGPQTVRNAAHARLAGIAVAAREVLIAERAAVIEEADRGAMFVFGQATEDPGA